MIIIGVNRGHNSAVCLIKNGEILFHTEDERLSRIKYHKYPFSTFQKIPQYVNKYDNLCVTGLTSLINCDSTNYARDIFSEHLASLGPTFYNCETRVYDLGKSHHEMHAACSFYNSGFKKAICIVIDDAGSEIYFEMNKELKYGRENTSTFTFEYPYVCNLVHKKVYYPDKITKTNLDEKYEFSKNISESSAFGHTSKLFGYSVLDAGKIMGMASYGKSDKNIPNIIVDEKVRNDIFCSNDLNNVWINFDYIKKNDFQKRANWSFQLQKQTQENVLKYILKMIHKTGIKNVCVSGGYFLNCVANYYIKKNLPKNINFYVEPLSSDAGTAMGAAKGLWYSQTKKRTIKKQKSIYYGIDYKYTIDEIKKKLKNEQIIDCFPKDVAKLISENNIVCIYQGKSESGPRSLGNRSILYNPTDPNGKNFVNKIKKREWFRPFAGTVLIEHASEWFDLAGMKESSFMMYAVNVKKPKKIPSIVHIDGTCRIQTLSKKQNFMYYKIIEEFYKITKVPMLFNTSFNLSGDPIVDSLDDALYVIRNSDINYLYLADYDILIKK
jgi:carbamoyltransferase